MYKNVKISVQYLYRNKYTGSDVFENGTHASMLQYNLIWSILDRKIIKFYIFLWFCHIMYVVKEN